MINESFIICKINQKVGLGFGAVSSIQHDERIFLSADREFG